jgi:hypothetical protein
MLVVLAQRTSASRATYIAPDGAHINLENNAGFQGFVGPNDWAFATAATGPFKLDKESNIAIEIILESRKPADERDLMPFLRTALEHTRKGVDDFIRLFGKMPINTVAPTQPLGKR